MNRWQLLQQIAYLLRARLWPSGAGQRVFGQVLVAPLVDLSGAGILFPLAVVAPGSAVADPQAPGLLLQQVSVSVLTSHTGDAFGEFAMLGGQRAGEGASRGRGLLEIEEQALLVLRLVQQSVGVQVQAREVGAVEARMIAGVGHVAEVQRTFECVCTEDRIYPAPTRLTATASGGGAVALAWAIPPTRFDLRPAQATLPAPWASAAGTMVLRRAAGATAPASATAGTGVTLGSALATSVNDAPGAGQWSYALFAGYADDPSIGSVGHYSAAATVTVTAT